MRWGRAAAAAAVAIAVLTSCSSGETANETLPPVTSSAAPTSEALQPLGPPDFPVPVEARVETAAGASAFVDYYISLMNRAQTQLTTDGLRELSNSCDACESFADGIDSYTKANYTIKGGGIQLNGTSEPAMINNQAEFSISVTQLAMDVLESNGNRLSELSATKTAFPASGAATVWSAGQDSWLMAELTIQ
jgi:hypothetical protein